MPSQSNYSSFQTRQQLILQNAMKHNEDMFHRYVDQTYNKLMYIEHMRNSRGDILEYSINKFIQVTLRYLIRSFGTCKKNRLKDIKTHVPKWYLNIILITNHPGI